jgi:tritrans,polycis-undecaprenyl-diphosphate synthase [geranylgeranyl-diphosphate specific]
MHKPLSSVAIIPDGNRRYAKKNNIGVEQAYVAGFRKSEEVVQWCGDSGVKSLTYWALSLDNFSKRSSEELSLLFRLMKSHAQRILDSQAYKDNRVTVKFFGKRDLLPVELNRMFAKIEEEYPERENGLSLNMGIAYSGRDELLNAAQKLAADISANKLRPNSLTETEFEKYLYLRESPDLLIRTGDSHRLSGMMPWQTVYSELYFSPKLWPEFSKQDFAAACEFYDSADRKFGK